MKNFVKNLSDGGLAEDTHAFMELTLGKNTNNEKMVNQKKFIKKALQWLKLHIKFETLSYADVWNMSAVDVLVTDFTTVAEMEENFRKTMEE